LSSRRDPFQNHLLRYWLFLPHNYKEKACLSADRDSSFVGMTKVRSISSRFWIPMNIKYIFSFTFPLYRYRHFPYSMDNHEKNTFSSLCRYDPSLRIMYKTRRYIPTRENHQSRIKRRTYHRKGGHIRCRAYTYRFSCTEAVCTIRLQI